MKQIIQKTIQFQKNYAYIVTTARLCIMHKVPTNNVYAQIGDSMKRMIGFILFWIAIGMTIMLFITNGILAICIIILCLILGYNLFSSC
jgi:hypothetical protein